MSQTLLGRTDRIAQSKRFRDTFLGILADGEAHEINRLLEATAKECGTIADDVAPVLSSAFARHQVSINFVDGTVRQRV